MKKSIIYFIINTLLILLLSGCGNTSTSGQNNSNIMEQSGVSSTTDIQYSNLADNKSQDEVIYVLQEHGITKEQTDTFLSWVEDFNSRVTTPELPDGFVSVEGDYVDYSKVLFDLKKLEDGSFLPEANCRLTAFLLMKNNIQTNEKTDDTDTYLMFDIEAINTYEQFKMSKTDQSNFTALYNWISVDGTTTLDEHIQKIQEAWNDRDIIVDGTQGISLINVYLHSPLEEVRFVGHTGILVETEKGLLFVEKFGPEAPFQATKFNDRNELKTYLLARSDLYGDDTELAPIVMENNTVLE